MGHSWLSFSLFFFVGVRRLPAIEMLRGHLPINSQPGESTSVNGSVNDVRSNIARLEARARNLLSSTDNRVARSGRGVFEVSKIASTEFARRQATSQGQQAPVELFMASLGFDVQEQQRLLQQMQVNRPPVQTYDDEEGSAASPPAVSSDTAIDLEAFLASRRSEALQRCVDEVHRHVVDRTRELSELQIRSCWERRTDEVTDALETQSLYGSRRAEGSSNQLLTSASAESSIKGSATSKPLLSSKIVAFAHIVDVASPQEWLPHFNDFVQSATSSPDDELSALWSTVDSILAPLMRANTATSSFALNSGVKRYVACSRMVLEKKFLSGMFVQILKVAPSKIAELDQMHCSKLRDIIVQYAGAGADHWAQIFFAMRCGRYDAAQLIAATAGLRELEAALDTISKMSIFSRNECKAFSELRALYNDEATYRDPYRCAVLLLLLVGVVGQDAETTTTTFMNALDKVSSSIDDMIWMRLVCVRSIDSTPPLLQSLVELQKSIVADIPQLLALPNSNVLKVASLLFHVALPSTAIRLLQEVEGLLCDAVHIALVFQSCSLLSCTNAEPPLNITLAVQRYVRLMLDYETKTSRRAASAIFNYFFKSNIDDGFIDLCKNEIVCTKLFGQMGDASANEGALLQGSCSKELLAAMDTIAEENARIGQVELAVHMLIILDNFATSIRDLSTSRDAVEKAIRIINPALSHNAHNTSGPNTSRESLLIHARRLQERLRVTPLDTNSRDIQAFRNLFVITEFNALVATGEVDRACQALYSLPFIPSQLEQLESCSELFAKVTDDVATAMPPTIITLLKVEVGRSQKMNRQDRASVVQRLKTIIRWVSKWRFHSGKEFSRELNALEAQLTA